MRGDSLRDFYAKTLAVVGLGLLAGAGAVVDYWPVDGQLPAVSDASSVSVGAPAKLPSAFAINIPAPVIRHTPRPAVSVTTVVAPESIPAIDVAPAPPPPVITLPAAPEPEPTFVAILVDPCALVPGPALTLADLGPMPVLSSGDAVDASHGILAGAIRKTKESLRGARGFLGAQLQGMMGAFKKVSPFWDATTVPFH